MGEPALAEQGVCEQHVLDVRAVDAHGDAHEHELGALYDGAVDAQQVRALQRLEPEKVILEVAVVYDGRVQNACVLLHHGVGLVRHESGGAGVAAPWPCVLVKSLHCLGE